MSHELDRAGGAQELGSRALDGNALTGPLLELFALDLVPALSTCAHCGATAPLAAHDLFTDAPALVLRCRDCTGVVLRYGTAGGRVRLDMSGCRLLVLPDTTDGR